MKNFYIVIALFVSFILFTACGGTDCEGSDCDELTDEISVTDENEVTDDATDETVDEVADDAVDDSVDSEPSDNEEIPDEEVLEIPQELLDIVGKLVSIDGSGVEGILTVTPRTKDFTIKIKWTEGLNGSTTWYGLELPLTIWEPESENYMTLKKIGENIVREDAGKDKVVFGTIVFKIIR